MAATQWDALVLEDYRAVMPLPWRSRAGIRYLYQPAFNQQTGIFSAEPVTPALVGAFLTQINRRYRFAEIYLNYGNQHPSLERRTNFILPLDTPYEQLAGRYKKDLVRNLRTIIRPGHTYAGDFDLHAALRDFQKRIRIPPARHKRRRLSSF